jgi:hypothetical protein
LPRNWTTAGERLIGHPLDDTHIFTRDMVGRAIDRLEWIEIPKSGKIPWPGFSEGYAISAAIRDFGLNRATHIATSRELAPYGFFAVRNIYPNGTAEIFVMDSGTSLTVVCTDFAAKIN